MISGRERQLLAQRFVGVEDVRTGLDVLDAAGAPDHPPDVAPIFICAAGWRTGSTLLQRILMTDPRVLIWGEPLARMVLIPRMAEAVASLEPGWPPDDYWVDGAEDRDLATSWVANLYPPAADLRTGVRALLGEWLARPAQERGHERWGLKEVRLGAAEAVLLRWLFPACRILVVVRDPLAALASQRSAGWGISYRRPDYVIDTPALFAHHWNRLATSWRGLPETFGHIVIRYESLVAGDVDFRELERALDLQLDERRALEVRVGGTGQAKPATAAERRVVRKYAAEGAAMYGYQL